MRKKLIIKGIFFYCLILSVHVLSLGVKAEPYSEKMNIALLRMELPRDFYANEQFMLADNFMRALYDTGKFVIVDRKDMNDIIQELKFQASDLVDQEEVVELGGLLGVDLFVTCSIRPVKGSYQISARLISVEQAKISKMVIKRCGFKFDYITALFNDVAYDLAGLEAEKGQLYIQTNPSQAEVFLFDMPKGYSPTALNLAPGLYMVSVKKNGYKPRKSAVEVKSNEKCEWKPKLYKKKRARLGEYIGGKSFWGKD